MTRVLLTGAGGFVGHHTLEHILATTDWDVVCTDSFRHSGKTDRIVEVIEGGPHTVEQFPIWGDRVTVVTHDLTVPFSDQLAMKIGHVDAIISMASESHVDRSIEFPAAFVANNVQLILNLLEFHREYVPHAIFLQVSTDEVYGPAPEEHDHLEWETFLPSNPYSASKAAQESIAFSYWRTFKTPLILTNTMNIIGERQDPEKFVPMVLKKVLDGDTVTIHASPEGVPGSRYYLHARNQADALVFLLKTYMDNKYTSTALWIDEQERLEGESLIYRNDMKRPPKFHVVGEREVDNLEMATLIAEYAGKPLHQELVDFHSSRPGHDLRYALDGQRIRDLGWTAPIAFEESLQKTVKWTMDRKDWLL